jgi:hypothetical protein
VQPDPVVPPKDDGDIAKFAQGVKNLAREMRCAAVHATVQNGRLSLAGFVGDARDLEILRGAMPQGDRGRLDVQLRPWPQCEALLNLARPLASNAGLEVLASATTLKEGESLGIRVRTPDFPSFLYVSYLQADGKVVHLRRYADQGGKAFPASSLVVLGERGQYKVTGPVFGDESLVVIASALPLLALDRPQAETEREYLTGFRLAILDRQRSSSEVAASFTPLKTLAK